MPPAPRRPIRADAHANEDKLLAAAATAFARDGAGATLKQIAKDAGVGIGTLYRRFPTASSSWKPPTGTKRLGSPGRAPELLRRLPAALALRAWMSEVLDHLATKQGMADTLRTLRLSDVELGSRTREQLTAAVDELRNPGIAEGTVREDVSAAEILPPSSPEPASSTSRPSGCSTC